MKGQGGVLVASEKHINVKINTTFEYLKSAGLSPEDIKDRIKYLTDCFGTKYPRMFPLNVNSSDIERISQIVFCLRKIEGCDGFDRHINQYDKNNIEDHLFSARVAAWFLDQEFNVILEPVPRTSSDGCPDLFVDSEITGKFSVECKNIDISNFYEISEKQEVADIVYKAIVTCDQIDVFLSAKVEVSEIDEIFSNPGLIKSIHQLGCENIESRIVIDDKLEVGIIQKLPITGSKDSFLNAAIGMVLEDNASNLRLPGYAFLKGGRSVGVFGPIPSYRSRWDNKRSKSKKQVVAGYPMVVMVNGDNVLGDPSLHKEYFNNVWLTENNPQCSGVGLMSLITKEGKPKLEYFKNIKAAHLFDL